MKPLRHIKLAMGIGAVCAATLAMPAAADQGIQIDDTSSTKTLSAVGKSDSETTVYTDTQGLTPKPTYKDIQDNPNFILSERAFPKQQPKEVEQPQLSEAEQKFIFFDKSENGLLSKDEFFLYELSADAQQVFDDIDKNADSAISFSEFEPYFRTK